MPTYIKLSGIILAMFCYGCAPSGEGASDGAGAAVDTETVDSVSSTQNLVASESFDFRSDRTIELRFQSFPSGNGKFVLYSQFEYFDDISQTYYPDYSTRMASFIANPDLVYEITLPSSQQFIVMEWLPMDGLSNEEYQLLALNTGKTYQASF